jgi:hypothetical protein
MAIKIEETYHIMCEDSLSINPSNEGKRGGNRQRQIGATHFGRNADLSKIQRNEWLEYFGLKK